MRALTPGEIAAGLVAITVAEAIIFGLIVLSIVVVARDVIAEEHRKAKFLAHQNAEKIARRRVKEILRNTQFIMPVSLINESDISWGEEGQK